MLKKPSRFAIFDYSNNSWHLEHDNYNEVRPEMVLLTEVRNKEQCYTSGVNEIVDEEKLEGVNNFRVIDIDQNVIYKQQDCMSNKTSTRKIPNILKNNSKLHGVPLVAPTETNIIHTDIESAETFMQIPFHSTAILNSYFTENTHTKEEDKYNRPRRRKQKHNYTDVWHDIPNWNIYSFIDDKQELLNDSFTTLELEASTQEKNLKRYVRKHNKNCTMSGHKTKQKKDLSSMVHNVSTDVNSELHSFSSVQETVSPDLQDAIDFSSNEIFNKFNYELYDMSNLDSNFKEHVMDSDETLSCLHTICDSGIPGKEHDINGNEVNLFESEHFSLKQDKQYVEDVATDQYLTPSECWTRDETLIYDKTPHCSSDVCCGFHIEDCVSNWWPASETKDTVLTETLNKHSISMDSDTNCQTSNYCTDLYATVYSADNTLHTNTMEQWNEKDSYLLTISEEETKKMACAINQQESNEHNELNYIEKQIEYDDQIQTNKKECINNTKFECLLCPLTFTNPRTMAMHQAGAHGGMYVILCESCGRLFNRKYHYNRHFVHCGRLKEPYKCDMCIRTYRHKSSLVHHLKNSHNVHYARNRTTTYTCSVCKKVYSKFGAFENHVKKHKTV